MRIELIAKGVAVRPSARMATLLFFVLVLALPAPNGYAQSQENPKKKAIHDLVALRAKLEASTWDRLADPLVNAARAANPAAPPETWKELRVFVVDLIAKAAAGPGGPREMIARRYDERFSEEEIQQLLSFFSSDLGRKFAVESALLQQDLERANALLLMRVLPQAARDLEGFFKERGLQAPR